MRQLQPASNQLIIDWQPIWPMLMRTVYLENNVVLTAKIFYPEERSTFQEKCFPL